VSFNSLNDEITRLDVKWVNYKIERQMGFLLLGHHVNRETLQFLIGDVNFLTGGTRFSKALIATASGACSKAKPKKKLSIGRTLRS
jgi:hypothetical protein